MSELLNKAVTLIDLLKPNDGVKEKSSTELSKLSGFNDATTHRILKNLEKYRFVSQNPNTKKFYLGVALIELGSLARSQHTIIELAKYNMEKIAEETKESIYLNVLVDNKEALLLHSIDSIHKLRIVEPIGLKLPLHIGSTRRVILAYMDRHLQDKYIDNEKIEKRTEHTFTNKNMLRQELDLIKKQGYATSFEETTEGTAGVSVPIFGLNGVEASLSIATPNVRINPERISYLVSLLKKNAQEISQKLGGNFQNS